MSVWRLPLRYKVAFNEAMFKNTRLEDKDSYPGSHTLISGVDVTERSITVLLCGALSCTVLEYSLNPGSGGSLPARAAVEFSLVTSPMMSY